MLNSKLRNGFIVLLFFLAIPLNLFASQIPYDGSFLFLVLFPLGALGLGLFLSWLPSKVSGWSKLAKVYRAPKPFVGILMRGKTIVVGRFMGYKGIMSLGADREGLYLEILRLFSLGSPALWIPWKDMSASEVDGLYGSWIALDMSKVPGVRLRFRKKDVLDLKVLAEFPDVLKSVS
jgi:hypothetical protein